MKLAYPKISFDKDSKVFVTFYINKKIEELGRRPYQIIPQRNNIVPKNIVLNTSGITDLISSKYDKLFKKELKQLLTTYKLKLDSLEVSIDYTKVKEDDE